MDDHFRHTVPPHQRRCAGYSISTSCIYVYQHRSRAIRYGAPHDRAVFASTLAILIRVGATRWIQYEKMIQIGSTTDADVVRATRDTAARALAGRSGQRTARDLDRTLSTIYGRSDMKNLAHLLAVPISEHELTFISLVAAATLLSRTSGKQTNANIKPQCTKGGAPVGGRREIAAAERAAARGARTIARPFTVSRLAFILRVYARFWHIRAHTHAFLRVQRLKKTKPLLYARARFQ
ncbi:hypothetical protein MSG28_012275 [Choristoneura fumiferana]|uniref:Uncharacterized protein n=1 Tax=Choristoneura fumiferana TaxID=7141 RepID=A0ACC0KCR4_CHOFU|nr:hypothetical protein MSG28_012275 [Choristoneura fumiferana]